MKSKSKIEKQLQKKKNPELVKTIIYAKKNEAWIGIAGILSGPRRKNVNMNLDDLNKEAKSGETIVVPGKVLSLGNMDKKTNIVALSFSVVAREKILKSGGKTLSILEEIKKNPEAKNVKILK